MSEQRKKCSNGVSISYLKTKMEDWEDGAVVKALAYDA